jgi:cation diffusion facilitator CzcD-associated flavoprotein CzcO
MMAQEAKTDHVDVLIVGAGISGIGSAYHLQDQCPGKSYVVIEAKDTFGGTWEPTSTPASVRTRSLHLRLPLQALDRRADRQRR